ncbi:MAG: AMP-binding protein, partial [Gemmobacter sp.]
LRAVGVGPGDRVLLMATNRPELLFATLGCGWAGAVAVQVSPDLPPSQLAHVVANAGPVLALVDPACRPAAEALAPPLRPRTLDFGEVEPQSPVPPAPAAPGDPFVILYTSGTTGPSKGVVCPQAQFYWWGVSTGGMLGLGSRDVLATCLPLHHTNALNTLFQALVWGASVVYLPRFSVSRFWTMLAESGATVTYLLGAMVPMLMAGPPRPEERAHRVRVALAPGVPSAAAEAFEVRTGIVPLNAFGSTESNCVIGQTVAHRPADTLGALLPGYAARVVDEQDMPLADGEAGELVLRADHPFAFASGYFAMPEATVAAWRNLWLHTGDRVIRRPDGQFLFIDRLKDAIRRRGENISSWEVEQVLMMHPDVAEAAVFPLPSDLAEDEVAAALVLRPGATADPRAIRAFCALHLPRHALPRFLSFEADLPRTANGKIRKTVLRERGRVPGCFDAEADHRN